MDDEKRLKREEQERILKERINQFLEIYRYLPSEHKAQMESVLQMQKKDMDDRTRALYEALFSAARTGADVPSAIRAMETAEKNYQTGV